MTYRETLNFVQANNLSVLDIEVANECDCTFDFDYTDEEFEKLCEFAESIYLKTEVIEIWEITTTINRLINEENKTIAEVVGMSKWDFISQMPI